MPTLETPAFFELMHSTQLRMSSCHGLMHAEFGFRRRAKGPRVMTLSAYPSHWSLKMVWMELLHWQCGQVGRATLCPRPAAAFLWGQTEAYTA